MGGWLKIILLIGIFFLEFGALGTVHGEEIDWDRITAESLEKNPELFNSTFTEIPEIPPMPIEAMGNAVIQGTGNVSDLLELENAKGEYTFIRLDINGTEDTQWTYEMVSANTDTSIVSGAAVSVTNATKFLLDGHSISSNNDVAYGGTGLPDWTNAPLFSGTAIILTGVENNESICYATANHLTGKIGVLNRAYRLLPGVNGESLQSIADAFNGDWSQDPEQSEQVTPEMVGYNQYSGAFLSMDSGTLIRRNGYAFSGPEGSRAIQNIMMGSSSGFINLLSEELPEGFVKTGNTAYHEIDGFDIQSLSYYGMTSYSNQTSRAIAYYDGFANGSIYEHKMSQESEDPHIQNPRKIVSDIDVRREGSTEFATLIGKSQIVTQPKKYLTFSQLETKGGTIRRGTQGVDSFALAGNYKVWGNLTAGSDQTSEFSTVTGQETMVIDGNRENTTRMQGAWTIKTPEKIPYVRWIAATNGDKMGYINEGQTDQRKVVKESAKADKTGVYIS